MDYGDGPRACQVPHAWMQDVDVRWEGPAIYRTTVKVTTPGSFLKFHGVSYQARVFVNDEFVLEHRGIWDYFHVPLGAPGRNVEIRVEVTKNGGESFPVKDVLSGFLPYVYNTFGGIFRDVEVVAQGPVSASSPCSASAFESDHRPQQRISAKGTQLSIDGTPWYMRGVLSWGWYPEVGSPHPPLELIRDEVRAVKSLGFNTIKFCLWLPPHHYFQVLEEEDMWAWVELPLWMPSENMDLEEAFGECERIVRQYRQFDRIICWTCGCELSTSTPHEFRQRLFEMVRSLTGCPLVKDNSGGSEMYGGDLREYGTFYDFHPYCDTQFYSPVLESLQVGPRKKKPILLGEFNDYDIYRPIGNWVGTESVIVDPIHPWIIRSYETNRPYWASTLPELNDQGVRWQHDLPGAISKAKAKDKKLEEALEGDSRSKAAWIREEVTKLVASNADIAGYVVTGMAETPISTSQVARRSEICDVFDGIFKPDQTFLIHSRQPPWTNGGNRPGWQSRHCYFEGINTIKIGARFERGFKGEMTAWWYKSKEWQPGDDLVFDVDVPSNLPCEVTEITVDSQELENSQTTLWIKAGSQSWLYSLEFFSRFAWTGEHDWNCVDPGSRLGGSRTGKHRKTVVVGQPLGDAPQVCFLEQTGTLPRPFWRECVTRNLSRARFRTDLDLLRDVACDRVIDPEWLESELPGAEWLLTRIDTRTYARQPYVARKGNVVVTTLRPWGGLGSQPCGLDNNPAGCELLRILMRLAAR